VLESRGLHSFQQKGAEDLAGLKKQAEDILASTNDAWREDFLSTDSGKVVNFLDWAQKAMATMELAKRPDMVALGRYVQMRSGHPGILANRAKHSLDDPAMPMSRPSGIRDHAYSARGTLDSSRPGTGSFSTTIRPRN
jgi:hypothetical protein